MMRAPYLIQCADALGIVVHIPILVPSNHVALIKLLGRYKGILLWITTLEHEL